MKEIDRRDERKAAYIQAHLPADGSWTVISVRDMANATGVGESSVPPYLSAIHRMRAIEYRLDGSDRLIARGPDYHLPGAWIASNANHRAPRRTSVAPSTSPRERLQQLVIDIEELLTNPCDHAAELARLQGIERRYNDIMAGLRASVMANTQENQS